MVGTYERQGFFFAELILDAVKFAATIQCSRPPTPKSSENGSIRRD